MRGRANRFADKRHYQCLDCVADTQAKCPYCQGTGKIPTKPSRQWLKALKERTR